MTIRRDLTGERYGRLVAVRATEKRQGRKVVWECRCDCGNIVLVVGVNLTRGITKSCGCLQRDRTTESNTGEKSGVWRGGKRHTGGYILIKRQYHPNATAEGYIREHRLVMEKKLGRQLKPEEVVHHIDGDKVNNAPENLIVFPNGAVHNAHHAKYGVLHPASCRLELGGAAA